MRRNVKILAVVVMVVFLAAGIWGVWNKQSYTDVASEENPLEYFHVAPYSPKLTDMIWDGSLQDTVREEANYIVKVKAIEELRLQFQDATQKVVVEEVFLGSGLEEGDIIEVKKGNNMAFFHDGNVHFWTVNMSFTNQMTVGEEYLIYLMDKVETFYPEDQIYLTVDILIAPIFAYCDIENVLPEQFARYVPYIEVKDNEFFAMDEDVLAALEKFKDDLMEGYR